MKPERRPKKRPSSASFAWPARLGMGFFVTGAALAAVAAWVTPQLPLRPAGAAWQAIFEGPSSHFGHFFDPEGLLGQVDAVDFDLDAFERRTTHSVKFVALPSAPADAPDFTMDVAEAWRPGVKGADNGVIVFVFPNDRRVRVEVGYGLEPVLPDIEVRRLVLQHLVPALSVGNPLPGVESLAQALLGKLETVPPATPAARSPFTHLGIAVHQLPAKARFLWRVWCTAAPGGRVILSTLAAAFVALTTVTLARFGYLVFLLAHSSRKRAQDRMLRFQRGQAAEEFPEILKLILILFAMMAAALVLPGTGSFGGGGVDVRY